MKKKTLIGLLCFLGTSSMLLGNEETSNQRDPVHYNHFHHLYFGPETFCFDLNTHFKGVEVSGTKLFLGFKIGYEYLRPKAFYFGVDLLAAGANKGFSNTYKGYNFPKSNGLTGFANGDFKFGYTFAFRQGLLSLFLGMGGYSFSYGHHNYHFDSGVSYLTSGFRSQYIITPNFNLGLNVKVFASIYTDEKFRFHEVKHTNHHGLWGGELGLPIIWRIGSTRRWDIQLEPYFLQLNFSEVQNVYGTRLLFGYYF